MVKQVKVSEAEVTAQQVVALWKDKNSAVGKFLHQVYDTTRKAYDVRRSHIEMLQAIPGGTKDAATGIVRNVPLDLFRQVKMAINAAGYVTRAGTALPGSKGDNAFNDALVVLATPVKDRSEKDAKICDSLRTYLKEILRDAKIESPEPKAIEQREKKAKADAAAALVAAQPAKAGAQVGNDNASKRLKPDAIVEPSNIIQFPEAKVPSFKILEGMFFALADKASHFVKANAKLFEGEAGSLILETFMMIEKNSKAVKEMERKAKAAKDDAAKVKAKADKAEKASATAKTA